MDPLKPQEPQNFQPTEPLAAPNPSEEAPLASSATGETSLPTPPTMPTNLPPMDSPTSLASAQTTPSISEPEALDATTQESESVAPMDSSKSTFSAYEQPLTVVNPEPTSTPTPLAPPTDPVPAGSFGGGIGSGAGPEGPMAMAAGGKSKKKLFGIIAAIGAVFLLGGGAAAYMVYNNTPEKILQDTFFNTLKQKEGSYNAAFEGVAERGKLTATGGWTKEQASADIRFDVPKSESTEAVKLTANIVVTKDKAYIKANGVKQVVSGIMGAGPSPYDGLITKIDGKWLLITENDLEEYFGIKKTADDHKRTQCIEDALNKFQTDKKQQREVYEVYKKNTFLVFTKLKDEAVESRGAYHFKVQADSAKAEAFSKELKGTVVYKAVHGCVKEDADETSSDEPISSPNQSSDKDQPIVDLWIDKSTRTLRKIQVKSNESTPESSRVTAQVTFDFKKKINITEPKADVTVKELKAEIDKMTQQSLTPVGAPTSRADEPQRLGVKTQRLPSITNVLDLFDF